MSLHFAMAFLVIDVYTGLMGSLDRGPDAMGATEVSSANNVNPAAPDFQQQPCDMESL